MKLFGLVFGFGLAALVVLNVDLQAQNRQFSGGFFPEASLSYDLNELYFITHKFRSQNGLFDNQSERGEELTYNHIQTDLQTFLGRSINPFIKVAFGYQYRIRKGENTHRPIQQVSFLQRESKYRIVHRIRTDQTLFKEADVLWRIRYRIKGQIPLQGSELDPGEQYLIISEELIYISQNGVNYFDNRFILNLGFYFDDKNKFEVGFDYRIDDYLVEDRFRHRLWLKLGYYKSL